MALYETKLADTLFNLGKIDEAQALFLKCAKVLEQLLQRDGSLRTEYALGHNAVRLGELYAYLAVKSRGGRGAQLELWTEARDSLQQGVTSLKKVTASATLQAIDQIVVDDGVASLARAEATLVKLKQH